MGSTGILLEESKFGPPSYFTCTNKFQVEKMVSVKNRINILQDNLGGHMCFLRIKEVFLTRTGSPEVIKEKINIFD